MSLLKTKRRSGNGSSFPSQRNDFWSSRLFMPRLFDWDEDFFSSASQMPLANMSETNKEYRIELSVPGCKKEDFDIDIDNGVLTISSEKEEEKKDEDKDKNYFRREFSYSTFTRSFTLPDNVDESKINAHYDNGMLEVTIPKKEVTTSMPKKKIKVD